MVDDGVSRESCMARSDMIELVWPADQKGQNLRRTEPSPPRSVSLLPPPLRWSTWTEAESGIRLPWKTVAAATEQSVVV